MKIVWYAPITAHRVLMHLGDIHQEYNFTEMIGMVVDRVAGVGAWIRFPFATDKGTLIDSIIPTTGFLPQRLAASWVLRYQTIKCMQFLANAGKLLKINRSLHPAFLPVLRSNQSFHFKRQTAKHLCPFALQK